MVEAHPGHRLQSELIIRNSYHTRLYVNEKGMNILFGLYPWLCSVAVCEGSRVCSDDCGADDVVGC
jgi:hypothetical protein